MKKKLGLGSKRASTVKLKKGRRDSNAASRRRSSESDDHASSVLPGLFQEPTKTPPNGTAKATEKASPSTPSAPRKNSVASAGTSAADALFSPRLVLEELPPIQPLPSEIPPLSDAEAYKAYMVLKYEHQVRDNAMTVRAHQIINHSKKRLQQLKSIHDSSVSNTEFSRKRIAADQNEIDRMNKESAEMKAKLEVIAVELVQVTAENQFFIETEKRFREVLENRLLSLGALEKLITTNVRGSAEPAQKCVVRISLPDEQFASVVLQQTECAGDAVARCCNRRALSPAEHQLFDTAASCAVPDSLGARALAQMQAQGATLELRRRPPKAMRYSADLQDDSSQSSSSGSHRNLVSPVTNKMGSHRQRAPRSTTTAADALAPPQPAPPVTPAAAADADGGTAAAADADVDADGGGDASGDDDSSNDSSNSDLIVYNSDSDSDSDSDDIVYRMED